MLNKDEIIALQKQIHAVLDNLAEQRVKFGENSRDENARLLGTVSIDLQNAINHLGYVIESFDSEVNS